MIRSGSRWFREKRQWLRTKRRQIRTLAILFRARLMLFMTRSVLRPLRLRIMRRHRILTLATLLYQKVMPPTLPRDIRILVWLQQAGLRIKSLKRTVPQITIMRGGQMSLGALRRGGASLERWRTKLIFNLRLTQRRLQAIPTHYR